jgi:5-bromo-4-chloroindolyl phosphate hydrolysis protein
LTISSTWIRTKKRTSLRSASNRIKTRSERSKVEKSIEFFYETNCPLTILEQIKTFQFVKRRPNYIFRLDAFLKI